MKKVSTIIVSLLIAGFLQAQTAERSVISSSGGSYSGPALQVDYTIGEMVISTVNNSGNILTQGFQQPGLITTKIEDISDVNMDISFYPNPCTDQLNIRFNEPDELILKAELFDVTGKRILAKEFDVASRIPATISFDLANVATGAYYMRISSDSKQVANFKVIKVNY